MKYNVFYRGTGAVREILITHLSLDELKKKTNQEQDQFILAKVTYTPTNCAEMMQHAQKIADYFEQVDTAKEAVIRCTKI
jgi:hypothetical protein